MTPRAGLAFLAVIGAGVGAYVCFGTSIYWSVACPGAAAASPQRAVCDTVGDFGGAVLIALVQLLALSVIAAQVRCMTAATRFTSVALLGIAAVLGPAIAGIAVFALISSPDGYCTAEQLQSEPGTNCVAYEGDF
jgi:hypothetical protein